MLRILQPAEKSPLRKDDDISVFTAAQEKMMGREYWRGGSLDTIWRFLKDNRIILISLALGHSLLAYADLAIWLMFAREPMFWATHVIGFVVHKYFRGKPVGALNSRRLVTNSGWFILLILIAVDIKILKDRASLFQFITKEPVNVTVSGGLSPTRQEPLIKGISVIAPVGNWSDEVPITGPSGYWDSEGPIWVMTNIHSPFPFNPHEKPSLSGNIKWFKFQSRTTVPVNVTVSGLPATRQ